jgi:hypothetical protein
MGHCYGKITIELVRMGHGNLGPKYHELLVLQQDAHIDRLDNGLTDAGQPWVRNPARSHHLS